MRTPAIVLRLRRRGDGSGVPVPHPNVALPLALTTFVGREDDMSELAAVLDERAPAHADRTRWSGQDPAGDCTSPR